jgi:DNA-binding PadR family transcriptional regulator
MAALTRTEESILLALVGKRLYGLQIANAIHQASGQCLYGQGRLYSILSKIETRNLISSEKTDQKYYELTDEGADELDKLNDVKKKIASWQPEDKSVPIIKSQILSKK